MLWTDKTIYYNCAFGDESELEAAILEVANILFGDSRIYLDVKKKIGAKGKTRNIPDGYLLDLSSKKEPRLYVVENELAQHDPLKHIAVQILQLSLSFETSPQTMKSFIRAELSESTEAWQQCEDYALQNEFDNVDVLLERMIYGKDAFNALVIIDELSDELETVLLSRFKFPVEIITLKRYSTTNGEKIYEFEPFLSDLVSPSLDAQQQSQRPAKLIDPSEIDTIVVPARKDGFEEVFLGENCWYAIRIHSSMIPKIQCIAAYQVAPESAITHVAPVKSIEQWKESNKYIIRFIEPAKKIGPIKLVPNGRVKALQNSRYTSFEALTSANTLDDLFYQ